MVRTIARGDFTSLIERAVTLLDVHRQNDNFADMVKLLGAEWGDPELLAEW